MVDPYAVLGVDRDASPETLKAAYIALMRRFHPDRVDLQNAADAERRCKEINAAFALISSQRAGSRGEEPLKRSSQSYLRPEARPKPSSAERERYLLAMSARRARLKRVRMFQQGMLVAALLLFGFGAVGALLLVVPARNIWPGVKSFQNEEEMVVVQDPVSVPNDLRR